MANLRYLCSPEVKTSKNLEAEGSPKHFSKANNYGQAMHTLKGAFRL